MIDVERFCQAFSAVRGDAIVVACQTTRAPWYRASTRPELDVLFRGAMGKGSSLALGLALARPDRRVVVFDGDGSLLMNLGTLATISDASPPNLVHFVLENGEYAGTGGQAIPGAHRVSFAGFATAAGYPVVEQFEAEEPLIDALPVIVAAPGPVFVALKTIPVPGGDRVKDDLPRTPECIARLRAYLAAHPA